MLQLHTGLIVWTIIIFVLLLFILRKVAWKPIVGGLEERTKKVKTPWKKLRPRNGRRKVRAANTKP